MLLLQFVILLLLGVFDACPMVVSDASPVGIPNTFVAAMSALHVVGFISSREMPENMLEGFLGYNCEIIFTDCFLKTSLQS